MQKNPRKAHNTANCAEKSTETHIARRWCGKDRKKHITPANGAGTTVESTYRYRPQVLLCWLTHKRTHTNMLFPSTLMNIASVSGACTLRRGKFADHQ
jgi:hypothetical protein